MTWASLTLFLHIVAASIWIGGQITIAALIPLLRNEPELRHRAGVRFEKVAWTAYAVLIATGIGNVLFLGIGWSDLFTTSEGRLVVTKIGFVLVSGVAAAVHSFVQAPGRRARMSQTAFSAWAAILGSASLSAALLAALWGVVIARGGQ